MHKEQKMKAIHLLETPILLTQTDREHHIPERLKPKCSLIILGISDSTKIALEDIYRTRHYLLTGMPQIVTNFPHLGGFSQQFL
jgi:hypothetical protein